MKKMPKAWDLFNICWLALRFGPGLPFVFLLSTFKKFGDGTGNESGIIDAMLWAQRFTIVIWILVAILVYVLATG